MAYRPPVLRKASEAVDPVITSVKDFPTLGNNTSVTPKKLDSSYADKALEWNQRKEEIEMNYRVEQELQIQRELRAQKRKEEEDYIRSAFPERRKKTVVEQVVYEPERVESEWTLVQRKPRKEKKSVLPDFEDDSIMEAQEPERDFDEDTIW
jgi:ribulose bisphosphate carboxylase small subunit